MHAGEYPDSGVSSELETKCDIRNEEGDADSDTESSPPPQDVSFTNDENKIPDDYTVSYLFLFIEICWNRIFEKGKMLITKSYVYLQDHVQSNDDTAYDENQKSRPSRYISTI